MAKQQKAKTKPKKQYKKRVALTKEELIEKRGAGGRPTIYTPELVIEFCAHIANGMSMRKACDQPGMPDIRTILDWRNTKTEFSRQYEEAVQERAEYLAEEAMDICDNQVEQPLLVDGVPMIINGKPLMIKDAVSVSHAKLRVETRKWFASKLKPKKFGDKTDTTHNLGDGVADFFAAISSTVGPPSKRDGD